MELRHPLSGDMAVVKSAPRCKSSFNRCAVALPLVMSHAPSSRRQSAVTRSPQKVVWPQRAHLRRHHHHDALRAHVEDSLPTRPIIFPRREARRDRQNASKCTLPFRTRLLHSVQFRRRRIRDPPPVLKLPPPLLSTSRHAIYRSPSFPPSSLPDIPDIPENIKGCQALQIVDFSSNPIPR